MKYGVYDMVDHVWMGNEYGPRVFDDETAARVSAQMTDVQMRLGPGRYRALPFPKNTNFTFRDEVTTKMGPLEALKRIEETGDLGG